MKYILKGIKLKNKVTMIVGTIASNQIIEESSMTHLAKAIVVNVD